MVLRPILRFYRHLVVRRVSDDVVKGIPLPPLPSLSLQLPLPLRLLRSLLWRPSGVRTEIAPADRRQRRLLARWVDMFLMFFIDVSLRFSLSLVRSLALVLVSKSLHAFAPDRYFGNHLRAFGLHRSFPQFMRRRS